MVVDKAGKELSIGSRVRIGGAETSVRQIVIERENKSDQNSPVIASRVLVTDGSGAERLVDAAEVEAV